MRKFLAFIFISILCTFSALAQVYTATARLDSSSILIGAQTRLTIDLRYPSGIPSPAYTWQEPGDTITKQIEVIGRVSDTTSSTDGKTTLVTFSYTITSFDTGFIVIPPLTFYKGGDTSKTVSTQALLLEVLTVPVDTSQAIKDIRAPMDAPFTLKEAMPWIIGGLLVLAAGFFLWWFLVKRKKQPETVHSPAPAISADELALKRLEELENQKLWQSGRIKEYYTGITGIIRQYLEERFQVRAMEQTSAEILYSLRLKIEQETVRKQLHELLLLSDMVKFAKENPLPRENEEALQKARDFINDTAQPKVNLTSEGGENA